LRGLGIGILITSLVFIIAGPKELSDEDIIKRAEELGYVKEESSSLGIKDLLNKETPVPTESIYTVEIPGTVNTPVPTPTDVPVETPIPTPTDLPTVTPTPTLEPTKVPTATPIPQPVETNTPTPTVQPTATPEPTQEPENVIKATIVVERGNSASMVCEQMETAGIVKDSGDFRKYLISRELTDFINIGTYEMSSDMSYKELAKILTGR
jgi:outer membrane biosynthesis protein TonB